MTKVITLLVILGCILHNAVAFDPVTPEVPCNETPSTTTIATTAATGCEQTSTASPPETTTVPCSSIPVTPKPSVAPSPENPPPTSTCHNNLTICEGKADNSNAYINETCSQYAVCISGCALIFTCPNDLLYNLQDKQCDYPQNVNCPWNSESSGPVAGPSGLACTQGGKCVNQTDGQMLPDANPKIYIVCQCECEVKRPCPAGLVFNLELKSCAFPNTSDLA